LADPVPRMGGHDEAGVLRLDGGASPSDRATAR
jgi:hypothetical protein